MLTFYFWVSIKNCNTSPTITPGTQHAAYNKAEVTIYLCNKNDQSNDTFYNHARFPYYFSLTFFLKPLEICWEQKLELLYKVISFFFFLFLNESNRNHLSRSIPCNVRNVTTNNRHPLLMDLANQHFSAHF